jgi:hypothetical protein
MMVGPRGKKKQSQPWLCLSIILVDEKRSISTPQDSSVPVLDLRRAYCRLHLLAIQHKLSGEVRPGNKCALRNVRN